MVAGNHPDHVKAEIAVGMNPGMNDTENFHTNYVCIIGKHDESNLVRSDGNILNTAHNELYHNFFGLSDDETLEVGTLYGSFEEGTARIFTCRTALMPALWSIVSCLRNTWKL